VTVRLRIPHPIILLLGCLLAAALLNAILLAICIGITSLVVRLLSAS